MKGNKAWERLCSIPQTVMSSRDLTPESKTKVIDTTRYAMEHNNETDQTAVLTRCVIAQLAEQYVAQWMKGFCLHGEENTTDPWTYSFDVLAGPEYYGIRIEVKTQQSGAKYVSVHTGTTAPYQGNSGLNIRPFLECGIADLIIVFKTDKHPNGGWKFTPFITCDAEALRNKQVVKKSNYSGHYINTRIPEDLRKKLNISYFQGLQDV